MLQEKVLYGKFRYFPEDRLGVYRENEKIRSESKSYTEVSSYVLLK